MADTCVSTPTLTRTDVGTTQSQSTSLSVSTTTAPGSVETVVIRTCDAVVPPGGNATVTASCIPVESTSYITHPGDTSVVTVPVVVPVDYPVTNLVTLWGSSCNVISSPPPDITTPITTPPPVVTTPTTTPPPDTPPPVVTTPTTTTPPDTPPPVDTTPTTTPPPYTPPPVVTTSTSTPPPYTPPPVTITTTSTSWSVYTPPPTTITSTSTITTKGSTIVSYFTTTSTSAATSSPVPQTGGAVDTDIPHKKSNNIGPIVGGVVGGIVALLLLGFIAWKLINKQPRYDNAFNNDHQNKTARDPDPKPYDYGPVGQQATDPTTMSPQMNPQGLDGQGVNDIGPQPSQVPPHHVRNPSLIPLLGAVGVAAAGAGAASISSTSQQSTSRPSTSQPSTSDSQMATQSGQGQDQGYLQNWGPNQTYGSTSTQGGYNAQGLASGSGQASGSVPTSSLAPNTGVGSTGSLPSGAGSSTGPYTPPIIPIIAGSVRNNRQQQYEDPFNRAGSSSSGSTQEQRILQVTNADPFSSYDEGSIYDPNIYYAEGPFSSSAAAGSSSLAGPSGGTSSASAFVMDGKGRRHNTPREKVPIVHLDGELYQQPVPGAQMGFENATSQSPGQAPPAYRE